MKIQRSITSFESIIQGLIKDLEKYAQRENANQLYASFGSNRRGNTSFSFCVVRDSTLKEPNDSQSRPTRRSMSRSSPSAWTIA